MIWLERFLLPDQGMEDGFLFDIKRTCYTTRYPFNVFRYRRVPEFTFEPVTILYGGNGSGKSTLLNVIAEKLGLRHRTAYNRSNFFEDYLALCREEVSPRFTGAVRERSRILGSDDVFDALLDRRTLNDGIDEKRAALLEEYTQAKYAGVRLNGLDEFDTFRRTADATRLSGSEYVRRNLMSNAVGRSNGESALEFFTSAVQEDALYLLDEPENSLSAARQEELAAFLSDSARFYGCQIILATHSPFLLAMKGAKIYDLSADPPAPRRWTELDAVRTYREFFRKHEHEF